MDRRGFLAGILAAGMAPAIVRAESLMRIVVPSPAFTFSKEFLDALANCDMVKIMETGNWGADYNDNWNPTFNSAALIIPEDYDLRNLTPYMQIA